MRRLQVKAKPSQQPKDIYAIDPPLHVEKVKPCTEYSVERIYELRGGLEFRELTLIGINFAGSQAEGLTIDTAHFSHVNLSASELQSVRITDAIIDACDLANSGWKDCSCVRVRMIGSRLTGARCNEAQLSNVLFSHTNLSLAQFRFAEFERVRFEHCDLSGADFYSADLRNAVFVDCELTEAQFCGAELAGADIRGSRIEGLQIMPENFKGLIVASLQAVLLSSVTGLVVKYDSDP